MSKRNLDDYESVKSRKKRFKNDYPDGRIVPELRNSADVMDYALFRVYLYASKEDQQALQPLSVGFALEVRDKELSKTHSGKSYASVNYTSWLENCEESAIGRALDNAGYAGNDKCSREEMEKAQRHAESLNRDRSGEDEVFNMLMQTLENESGEFQFSFGKFKGQKLKNIELDSLREYYKHLISNKDLKGEAYIACKMIKTFGESLKHDKDSNSGETDSASA